MAKFIDSDFFRGVLNRMVEHLEAVGATRDAETIKSVIRFLKVMEEFHAVEVVRCKECEHRGDATYCPMCFEEWYEMDEGDGYYDLDFITHDRTIDEGFCDRGERRTDE